VRNARRQDSDARQLLGLERDFFEARFVRLVFLEDDRARDLSARAVYIARRAG
jgi:hypothetical protein